MIPTRKTRRAPAPKMPWPKWSRHYEGPVYRPWPVPSIITDRHERSIWLRGTAQLNARGISPWDYQIKWVTPEGIQTIRRCPFIGARTLAVLVKGLRQWAEEAERAEQALYGA